MANIHVMPNPEKLVDSNPVKVREQFNGKFLPEDGKLVPHNIYWSRRLRDGDVVRTDQVKKEPKMSLAEAIKVCLDANDDEHLTKSGKPDCNVLSKLTGEEISAAARDEAVAAMED